MMASVVWISAYIKNNLFALPAIMGTHYLLLRWKNAERAREREPERERAREHTLLVYVHAPVCCVQFEPYRTCSTLVGPQEIKSEDASYSKQAM